MKGGWPPAAAFAVFTSHPATPPTAALAPLSQTARLLNPPKPLFWQHGRSQQAGGAGLSHPQQIRAGTGQHLKGDQAAALGLLEVGDTPESSRKEEQAAACMVLAPRPGLCYSNCLLPLLPVTKGHKYS